MKRFLLDSPGWLILLAPLLAVLAGTLFGDRAARPPDRGEEPTYALLASSLAWDFDLRYTEQDYRRYVDQWGVRPKGIDLDSRDGGRTQVFARPFYHALLSLPFVRMMPYRGLRVLNALLLATAAILAAWALGRGCGKAAPVWVAVFVFASATFSYVFLSTADVFLLAVTAAGFALVYADPQGSPVPQSVNQGEQGPRARAFGTFGRWLAIGVLLAVPGTYRLPYLLLLLPAAVALHRSLQSLGSRRAMAWSGLALGAAAVFALTSFIQAAAGGEPFWSLAALRPALDTGLLLWNGIYFLAGRSVGILPYFLPVLLALAAFRPERGRWSLIAAAGLASLAFLVLRPYDFAGVGGGVGNRLFLPLYAALWFLPAQPLRTSWAVVAAALAAPVLFPVWVQPAAPEPSRLAVWLPYEATQQDLPGEWVAYGGIRVKPTSRNIWRAEHGTDLRIAGDETGGLVAASLEPLDGLVLDFDRNAPTRLIAGGQELRPTVLRPDGSVSFEIPLGSPRTHPMGWTRGGDAHVYQVSFRLPEAPARPIGFRVHASRDVVIQRSGEGR